MRRPDKVFRASGFTALVAVSSIAFVACSSSSASRTTSSPTLPSGVVGPAHLITGCPNGARQVTPADDVASQVASQAAGTQFCFTAGTYQRLSVVPQAGDGFFGMPGAVIDGMGSTTPAFKATAADVTIMGLTIRGYSLAAQTAAIDGRSPKEAPSGGTGWHVAGNLVTQITGGRGITAADGWVVSQNIITNNGELGLSGNGQNVRVENNEIAANNQGHYDKHWEGGGVKFVAATNLMMRGNYVHDNLGVALWCDIGCDNVTFDNNTVVGNLGAGVFFEISHTATITNNKIMNNGEKSEGWLWDGGIQVAASDNVTISGNTVQNDANGISLIQQRRGSGQFGQHLVANITVSGNMVSGSGRTGLVVDDGDSGVFSRGIHFSNNTYHLAEGFAWSGSWVDWSGWNAAGQDQAGSWSAT